MFLPSRLILGLMVTPQVKSFKIRHSSLTKGHKAYPPPHQEVRDFFTPSDIGGFSRYKLEYRYLRFFKQLFDMVNTRLSRVGSCGSFEAFALAWHSKFTETEQNTLYGEVVEVNAPEHYFKHPPDMSIRHYQKNRRMKTIVRMSWTIRGKKVACVDFVFDNMA